ncbi:hypothetical protein [Dysgonomonas sp.]|jgi:hypothetical protein|uniref:hypothetical protein n=1 Tax=Dysgonomonas sp. TaxID=1891233 RepID=UPI002BC40EE1|nr:hypothetical protein [Dysgonomonas sp.]HMM03863.1 hypothetical protein [Dysgonomonas sp.]
MDTEEREQHKLRLIKTILASSGYKETELLSIYAFYLSSAPDTLYNISYYTDRIDDFIKRVNDLPKKVKWFDSIFNKIKSEIDSHPLKDKFIFIFDDLFIYTTSTFEIRKENVDVFRLDLVTPNKFSLRMTIKEFEIDFLFEYPSEKYKDIDILINSIKETILKYYPLPKES